MAGCLANLALLAGGLIAACLLGEWAVRLAAYDRFHPMVPSGERGLFWQYDRELGWKHRPGQRGRFQKPGAFDTAVAINSSGFRGPERSLEPAAGTERLVVLGDSVTWGYGVEDAEVFTEIMGRIRPGTEAVNLAVSGYGTDQESLLLEREGMNWHPSIVLIEVCENDFVDVTRDQVHGLYPKPRFRLRGTELVPPRPPVPTVSLVDRGFFWLDTRSWLWRLIGASRPGGSVVSGFQRAAWRVGLSRALPPLPAPGLGERLLVALLDRTRVTARGGGADFAVFLVAPMSPPHRRAVEEFGQSARVDVIDLAPPFSEAAASGSSPLFLPNDLHWTPVGHEVTAKAIARWLDARAERRAAPEPPPSGPLHPAQRRPGVASIGPAAQQPQRPAPV
jgi:lysophospholipase L1-like esterase